MSTKTRTVEQCKEIIQKFANKHKIIFIEEGEVGFGRECVGLAHGDNYIDYNPTKYPDHSRVEEVYDKRFYDIVPEKAYHKHNCLAVLGRGDDSIRQLCDWVEALEEIGVEIVTYETGAVGLQALLTGLTGKSIKAL